MRTAAQSNNYGLCAGICKHVRFCWIFVRQAGGTPFHRILAACVIGNVFKPFVKLLCPDSSSAQFPKRLAHGELARYKAPSLNRELVCPNGSRSLQILRIELASVNIPHRIRASHLPARAFTVTSQDRGTA